MYIRIPEIIFVPIYYVEIADLNIVNAEIFHEVNFKKNSINKPANRKSITIGVSFSHLGGRWNLDKSALEAYSKEKGVSLKIENADFDAAKQNLQVERLLSQGINVLIVIPTDIFSLAELIEKAKNAGIKVISYEELAHNSNLDLYITFNDLRVGELQGEYLVEHVPKGNYIILYGDPQSDFKEGAMEYIQPLINVGSIKVLADRPIKNWDPDIAYKVVDSILTANNNKVNAILAPNDRIAGAAIEALKKHDLAGKVAVTGQDANLEAVRRILQGTQSMTVFKDINLLSKKAIDAAIQLSNAKPINVDASVNNGKMYVPTIYIEPISIDKNNIDSVLIKGGYYKKEQLYERLPINHGYLVPSTS